MAPTAVSPSIDASKASIHPKTASQNISHPTPLTTTTTTAPSPSQTHYDDDDDDPIPPLRQTLTSEIYPLASRFRALFTLKHHASLHPPTTSTSPAIHAIAAALTSPSALLKHELAYCLGQTGNPLAVPYLQALLKDRAEDAMCRHEAAEALGALGDRGSLELLREMGADGDREEEAVVRETCEIAIERILWMASTEAARDDLPKSDFVSVDPAPPVAMLQIGMDGLLARWTVPQLRARLLNPTLALFQRYRALFALRDLACPPDLATAVEAVEALAAGLLGGDSSALFRHEVAFVFGQLEHPASVPFLMECLARKGEVAMVRHEAAEALGSLGEVEGVEDFLRGFLHDEEVVVRESVVVALDMAEEGREFSEGRGENCASRHM